MTADEIINEIQSIPCNDPALLPLGTMLHEYTLAYKSGDLSKDEYVDLLKTLHFERILNAQCEDLHAKERLNTICNVVINAASMLA
ncbi:MAG: hypothetical protein RLZZ196_1635 [Bacteroidota bacterium]|jgi:hypothetical protein